MARQADLLSFDTSTEGERLRRYQFSCSRSLFRSLDTLFKVRRSGPGAVRGKGRGNTAEIAETTETRTERNDDDTGEIDPTVPTVGIVESLTETEPSDREVDHRTGQDETAAPQVAVVAHRRLPIHRALFFATTLIVLFGAAVRSHRDSRIEPTTVAVNHQNGQNEAITTPRQRFLIAIPHHGVEKPTETMIEPSTKASQRGRAATNPIKSDSPQSRRGHREESFDAFC